MLGPFLVLESRRGPPPAIALIKLPRDSNFTIEIRPNGRVPKILSSFADERERWGPLIPEGWLEKIGPLQALFTGLINEQKPEEEERIVGAELSPSRVREFKKAFVMPFEESATLRHIFAVFGAIKDETNLNFQSPDTRKWGLNILDDKEAYVEGSERIYRDWGENYGGQLASSESSAVMEIILAKLQTCQCPDVQGIEAKLVAAIKSLKANGMVPRLVLAALDVKQRMELESSTRFEAAWRANRTRWKKIQNFEGMFLLDDEEVPIFWIRRIAQESVACVLDLPQCLTWIQQSPARIGARAQALLLSSGGPF